MNLFLCAYNSIGCRVLETCLGRKDISRLAVFTHPPGEGMEDIRAIAMREGVFCTTEDVSTASWPFVPDVVASVYYRYILKQRILEACAGKAFNVHPSLLPRHRGCSSIPWAIIEGDQFSGVSFHYIDQGIDTGALLLQAVSQLREDETQASLYSRLMDLGHQFWPAALSLVAHGLPGVPQHGEASYHRRGCPYGGVIDESWEEDRVRRFIRAMTYPPYPPATFRGQSVATFEDYRAIKS